jgi:hypothetical protein
MVREVATRSSDQAGDGTTTATVLVHAIAREGAKSVAAGMNPTAATRRPPRSLLTTSVAIKSGQNQGDASNDGPKDPAKVGDLIQAEIDGALVFEKPKRVRAIQDYDGKPWVFVDGSETGIPMDQVTVVENAAGSAKVPPEAPRLAIEQLPTEWREERLLDEAGEEIFLRYKGEPSKQRYEFIRDYLDFKLKRMK